MINHEMIFLAGHHRSGTSLLHEIIREHPDITGFQNTGVPEDEGQHLQCVIKPARAYGGPGKYIFNRNARMTEHHCLATEESAHAMMSQWKRHYGSDNKYYVEKSPPNLIRTRFLQKIFPNSKFIVILRHPIAVALATQKWSRTSVKSLLDHTLLGYETFAHDRAWLDKSYVLRYEKFVRAPQRIVDDIFRFLQLPSVRIEHSVKSGVNDKYYAMWESTRLSLKNRVLPVVNRNLEKRANRFGYSLVEYEKLLPCDLEQSIGR